MPLTVASCSRVFDRAWRGLVSCGVLAIGVWGTLALLYCLPHWVIPLVVEFWVAAAVGAVVLLWRRRTLQAFCVFAAACLAFAVWWGSLRPSDTRLWADDVALHLDSRIEGDRVTLYSVRNFTWRSQTDYDVRWETRDYDLRNLTSVDVICSYWMGPAIAHTLVSFGFAGGEQLVFSIEIRKERGEEFSAIGGFFKQFEATLIAADERDILRVRTNVRGEDVYLYRVVMPPEAMRSLFMAYLDEARSLRERPQWYNTLTANCTTIVWEMAKRMDPSLTLDWRLLVSGYLPNYLYEHQRLTTGYDFETLRSRGRVTDRAKGAVGDFSRAIRAGVPGSAQAPEIVEPATIDQKNRSPEKSR